MSWQDPANPGGEQPGAPPPPPGYPPASSPGAPAAPPPPPGSSPQPWAPPPAAWAPPPGSALYGMPGSPGMRYGSVLGRFLAYWLDSILVGIGGGLIAGFVGVLVGRGGTATVVSLVIVVGINLMYFVGFWTGGSRATPGMRLMKLQVGNAADGSTLTTGQALIRWLALYGVVQVVAFLPTELGSSGGLATVEALAGLWFIALLVSTLVSSTRQGIHDRLARSLMVQPDGAQTPATACLILLILLVVLPLFAIVALILLGGQVSNILSQVGASI